MRLAAMHYGRKSGSDGQKAAARATKHWLRQQTLSRGGGGSSSGIHDRSSGSSSSSGGDSIRASSSTCLVLPKLLQARRGAVRSRLAVLPGRQIKQADELGR